MDPLVQITHSKLEPQSALGAAVKSGGQPPIQIASGTKGDGTTEPDSMGKGPPTGPIRRPPDRTAIVMA